MNDLRGRIKKAEGLLGRSFDGMDPDRLRALVVEAWNPAYGSMTPARLDAVLANFIEVFATDVASGTEPETAVRSCEAAVRVMGALDATEYEDLVAEYDTLDQAPAGG